MKTLLTQFILPMPKKSAPKKTSSVVKKAAPKKVASKSISLNQRFLEREEAAFHRTHPQAEKLISIFLIVFLVLVLMFLYRR